MKSINKKLLRELWAMRTQAIAIALVITSGVGIFIMSLSTLDSLYETRESYYRDHHFAQVFATLKRAPLSLAKRIEAIPGVDKVETRVVAYVNIDVPGFEDPISGHLVSLPDNGRAQLNQLYLESGRLPSAKQSNEILISEAFANAHQLQEGARFRAVINGRAKRLNVVGSALSPEYIYQIAPGAMFPDHLRYGVFWMPRSILASAYNMEGAFNDVSLTLTPGTNPELVIDQLDELLKSYGGIGSYARKDQLSNRFLSEELRQQKTMATVFPIIFFGVAAFLLNVVISRLISLEREQIASLKAFGYSNLEVGLQYIKLVLMIVALGVAGGIIAGIWMGKGMSNIYMTLYSFPFMHYILKPQVILAAIAICVLVSVSGTLYAVYNAVRLPPAQAMRPELPKKFRKTLFERLGVQAWLPQPTRMILRHIERRPIKSMLTTLGISMACGIMMVGGFQKGAIDYMVEVKYSLSQRADMIVNYTEPTSLRSLYSLTGIEGIKLAEGFRNTPVSIRYEHRHYRTSIQGIEPAGNLMRLLNTELNVIKIPPRGLILTDYLAELLNVKPGDVLTVEILEGHRPTLDVTVAGTTKEYIGLNAYMQRTTLNALLNEGDAISGAFLKVDEKYQKNVYRALKEMPRIAGIIEHKTAIKSFYDTIADTILTFTFITTLLGGSIVFGVVYNSMRIALSERSRELASLRVLGFKKEEVAYILFGEMALFCLVAIPLGMVFGYALCLYLASEFNTDLYRIPLVLGLKVYAFAALVIIASSLISALLIWRHVTQLDMVAVLKNKE